MRFLPGSLLTLSALLLVTGARDAAAQDVAAAEALFNRGLADMQAGKYDSGCPAIGESYRLDPRAGTLFTWAECESKAGHTATAVARYDDYLSLYSRLSADQQAKQKGRDKVAAQAKADLQPHVPQLTLTLPPNAPKGTTVKRDDIALAGPSLGIPLPVDPGAHVIASQVPGGPLNEMKISIAKDEKKTVLVEIKMPGDTAIAPPPPTGLGTVPPFPTTSPSDLGGSPPPPDRGSNGQKIGGFVALGIGGAGLVAGIITGVLTLGKKSDIDANCNDVKCNAAGKSAADSASTTGLVSTIGFAVGLAGVAAGTILIVTAPSRPKTGRAAPRWIGAGVVDASDKGAQVGVRGTW